MARRIVEEYEEITIRTDDPAALQAVVQTMLMLEVRIKEMELQMAEQQQRFSLPNERMKELSHGK